MNRLPHWIRKLLPRSSALFKELAGTGITQVIVTHEVEVARKTASRVVYMENGRTSWSKAMPASVFKQPQTKEFANLSH
jgi:arginine transport system ATP-binding protein